MSEPRLVAYIDEAGDQGDKYGNGSSNFLAFGAAITAVSGVDSMLSVFAESRVERGHAKTFKKFSSNNEKDNFVLTKQLALKPVRSVMVALHKPSMAGSHIRSNRQKEYQYLVKYTLERVSWLARDSAKGGKPEENRCKVIFSKQESYSYEDLCAYLNKLRNGEEKFNCSIEWDFLHEVIEYAPHENERPIHFADLVASAFHKAIEPKIHGMRDDRFARNLFPTIYRRNGVPYGLKLFPPREIDKLKAAGELEFLKLL